MEEETTMERKSSIEQEPRTLHLCELQFAREAAQCVVNTRSEEEALGVFTEGLLPVVSCGSNDEDRTRLELNEEEEEEELTSSHNLLQIIVPRNIASAPF